MRLAAASAIALLTLVGCGSDPKLRPAGTAYLAGVEPGTVTVLQAGGRRATKRRLRRLMPGDPLWSIAPVGRALVVFGLGGTYAYDSRLHEPPRALGRSSFFVPSAHEGRVWLIEERAAREVALDGMATTPLRRFPGGSVVGAVDGGLLLQHVRHMVVWNPRGGAVERGLPGVFPIATHRSLVASCADRCPALHITDTRSGADSALRGGPGWHFEESYDGAFSNDGTWLAAPARTSAGVERIALVDTRTRAATLMPGGVSRYPVMAWAASGWLFYSAGERRVGAYRPGERGPVLLPQRVAPFTQLVAR